MQLTFNIIFVQSTLSIHYACAFIDAYISVVVVVNFDALAQASDIRIEKRQVVFLRWMQDSNQKSYMARVICSYIYCVVS